MNNVIVIAMIFAFVVFVLLFQFKIKIYNRENYLFINVCNFVNLKLNLLVLLSNINNLDFEKQKKNFKLIKNISIKELNIKLEGLNLDYQINGAYYGLIHAVFGFIHSILYLTDIKFQYNLKYQGEEAIEFQSVIRARILNVIKGFARI